MPAIGDSCRRSRGDRIPGAVARGTGRGPTGDFLPSNRSERACAGPITSSSQNISGAGQQRIEEHLQQLRCKDSNDPNCNAVGAAAADSVSYAGLSFFVSGDYEHKDRTATGAELGFDSTPSDRPSGSTIASRRTP